MARNRNGELPTSRTPRLNVEHDLRISYMRPLHLGLISSGREDAFKGHNKSPSARKQSEFARSEVRLMNHIHLLIMICIP